MNKSYYLTMYKTLLYPSFFLILLAGSSCNNKPVRNNSLESPEAYEKRMMEYEKELKEKTDARIKQQQDESNGITKKCIDDGGEIAAKAKRQEEIRKQLRDLNRADREIDEKDFASNSREYFSINSLTKTFKSFKEAEGVLRNLSKSDLMNKSKGYYDVVDMFMKELVGYAYGEHGDLGKYFLPYHKEKKENLRKRNELMQNNKDCFDEDTLSHLTVNIEEERKHTSDIEAAEALRSEYEKLRERLIEIGKEYYEPPYNSHIDEEEGTKKIIKESEQKATQTRKNIESARISGKSYEELLRIKAQKTCEYAESIGCLDKLKKCLQNIDSSEDELWGRFFEGVSENNKLSVIIDAVEYFKKKLANTGLDDKLKKKFKKYFKIISQTKSKYEILKIQIGYATSNVDEVFCENLPEKVEDKKALENLLQEYTKIQYDLVDILKLYNEDSKDYGFNDITLED